MLNIRELIEATNGTYINGDYNYIPKNYVIDSRDVIEDTFFIPIKGENVDGHNYIINTVKNNVKGFFINSNYINKKEIIEESIKINKNICIIEVEDTIEALYEAGKYNRNKHIYIPVVAVTGSVGKTSTREMIASVLKEEKNVLVTKKNYNSLIGAPIMTLEMDNQDICVFEVGTDHKGEMEKLSNLVKPNISVITIIGTAHIGIFKTRENIFKEKTSIVTNMQQNSILVVNGEDDYLTNLESDNKYEVIKIFDKEAYDIKQSDTTTFKTKIYNEEVEIKLNQLGKHNIKNALFAIKIAERFNLKKESIVKGIENYKNFSRRLERIDIENNITLIDDTYNASIDSMKSGLGTINEIKSKRKIAVLGDMLELGDMSKKLHTEVGEYLNNLDYDKIFLFGEEVKYIKEAIIKKENVLIFKDIEELIKELKVELKPNDIVYLKASNSMRFDGIINSFKK